MFLAAELGNCVSSFWKSDRLSFIKCAWQQRSCDVQFCIFTGLASYAHSDFIILCYFFYFEIYISCLKSFQISFLQINHESFCLIFQIPPVSSFSFFTGFLSDKGNKHWKCECYLLMKAWLGHTEVLICCGSMLQDRKHTCICSSTPNPNPLRDKPDNHSLYSQTKHWTRSIRCDRIIG